MNTTPQENKILSVCVLIFAVCVLLYVATNKVLAIAHQAAQAPNATSAVTKGPVYIDPSGQTFY